MLLEKEKDLVKFISTVIHEKLKEIRSCTDEHSLFSNVDLGQIIFVPVKWVILITGWVFLPIKWMIFICESLPGGSVVKNPPANSGDTRLIHGSGRSPGGGNGDPL